MSHNLPAKDRGLTRINSRVWHRGTAVDVRGLSPEEQLQAAGLDWQVLVEPFYYGENKEFTDPDKRVAYRSHDQKTISLYDKRQPWQNTQILSTFNNFCEDAGLQLAYLGSLHDQNTLYAAAKLEADSHILGSTDEINWWLILRNSHINGKGMDVSLYSDRLVCTNGMRSVIRDNRKVITHVGEFNHDRVTNILKTAIRTIHQQETELETLAKQSITKEEAVALILSAYGEAGKSVEDQPPVVQTILRLFNGGGLGSDMLTAYNTAYGLLQATTEYFNWHMKNTSGAFASILDGSRASSMNKMREQLVGVYARS